MSKALELLKGRHLDKKADVLLTTVSGVASTKDSLIKYFDVKVDPISIITTKSFQVEPNPGNREPVICEPSTGNFGNSVGLRNSGMEKALYELHRLREEHTFRSLINVSLSANTIEDFITLVKEFDEVADLVELNFSCPHASAGYGASIGCDQNIATEYVKAIKAATKECKAPLFIKLTPNVDDIGSIAKAIMDSGADGLVAINTVGPNLHLDPVSGAPILQNKLGGKGGSSGRWIHEQAVSCIKQIRAAVGHDVPLIGMGGVSTSTEVAQMIEAGSDAVGIGSAFGTVNQKFWPEYTQALKREAESLLKGLKPELTSESYLIKDRQMAYAEHVVQKFESYGYDTVIITLDGELDCKAGQFAFLWLPGIGEKPFSVAHNSPLTFVIKRRGPFSEHLCNLAVGQKLYVRGLYGAELENTATKQALLLAGGTGVAVLPSLAAKLADQGTEMTILVGTSESVVGEALLESDLSPFGSFSCVADDGKPGRVLDMLDDLPLAADQACYLVGPEIFMAIAARKLLAKGIKDSNLYLSMERMTLCGIGMCGECVCGDRLTCRWGSFLKYDYLEKEAPELISYD